MNTNVENNIIINNNVISNNNNGRNGDCISETNTIIDANIYRYKFTDVFIVELSVFAKVHQYDERKQFKEEWNKWIEDNSELICRESRRLYNLGYDGDIIDKMFKSARYYFRKKSDNKKEPKKRREYISIDKTLLKSIDDHIKEGVQKEDYQPKKGFQDFCEENKEILRTVVNEFCKKGITDPKFIEEKIKKTYKNRYFIFINK